MADPIQPIPQDLLKFERMALRIKLAAAVIYARDSALEQGGTDEQFAARMGLTVRQFRQQILSILKIDVDDMADVFTALEARLYIGTKNLWPAAAPSEAKSPEDANG